mmetsp:Transcript_7865/g.16875  ORF Transcript_7865/g.16875 Transcript_7865/m.16875 type:complete len:133 (-) Transcript_7865:522-920(-)
MKHTHIHSFYSVVHQLVYNRTCLRLIDPPHDTAIRYERSVNHTTPHHTTLQCNQPANVRRDHPTFPLGMSQKLMYIRSSLNPNFSRASVTPDWIIPLFLTEIDPMLYRFPRAQGASDPPKITLALSVMETPT